MIIFDEKISSFTVILKSKFMLFITLNFFDNLRIIGVVYVIPLDNLNIALENINDAFQLITPNYANVTIFIGGDFNAIVGMKNQKTKIIL